MHLACRRLAGGPKFARWRWTIFSYAGAARPHPIQNSGTCFKGEPDKAIFGTEGPEDMLTGLPPVGFHETRCVPALSHRMSSLSVSHVSIDALSS